MFQVINSLGELKTSLFPKVAVIKSRSSSSLALHLADWAAGHNEEAELQWEAAAGAAAAAPFRFSQRGAAISNPLAASQASERQLRWDPVRKEMQRSYVQHLPEIIAVRKEQQQLLKAALERRLDAQHASCRQCSGIDMQKVEPVEVLYISVDHCLLMAVPRYRCQRPDCGGGFAPSPFAAGCFPATPKVSWDVAQSNAGQPARWFDLRLLQLADGLRFQTRRTAVHSFAAVVHQQHVQNGCGHLLGWEHFKRQLSDALAVRCAATWCYIALLFSFAPFIVMLLRLVKCPPP